MDQKKPEYFRPALIAGAVAGLLSGLPFFSLFNCVCCLWILGGAAMAVMLLAKDSPGILKPSDGAIVGALTGIVAAVVHTVLTLAIKPNMEATARQVQEWLSRLGYEMPSNFDSMLERGSAFMSPTWAILGLFVTAAMYAVIGVLGGIIGVSLFGRKTVQAAPPPAAPPPPSPGPGNES